MTFPVASLAVGKTAALTVRGGLRIKARRRAVVLRGLRLRLAPRRSVVTAKAGKRRIAVFVARIRKGDATLNRSVGAAALESAKLHLTPRAARLLRARLRLRRLPSGALGVLALDAISKRTSIGGGQTGGGGGGGGGGGAGGGTKPCDPNPGALPGDPADEPTPLARPPGAVDITSATITWRPRPSFINYINGGEGTCVLGGATDGSKDGSAQLVYSFGLPFATGWLDGDEQASISFTGGVGFRWASHMIDFATIDPTIEISGAASRMTFRLKGVDGTPFPNQRYVFLDLDVTGPIEPGQRYTLEAVLAEEMDGTELGGYWAPDPSTGRIEWGTVEFAFTTAAP